MNKETQKKPASAKRNYKDTLFRMVFREPEALLSLYNAVNGTDYRDASELKVIQLNIRAGHNEALMQKCPVLKQYAQYVERVQKYAEKKHLNEAVEMSIFEYDEEKELALLRKAEREVGREEGRDRSLVEQVCKKLRKGQTAERIAEELEAKMEVIRGICEKAAVYAPGYDDESIYMAWHK